MNTSFSAKKNRALDFLATYAWYFIFAAFLLTMLIANYKFFYLNNLLQIAVQASTKGILALGAAGIMVLGGVDLSVGRILGTCAAVTGSLVQSVTYAGRFWPDLPELPWIVPLFASIAIAVIFCAINGFGVAVLKLHAFIISLGTQQIAFGVTCIYIAMQEGGSKAISSFNSNYTNIVTGGIKLTGKDAAPFFQNISIPYLMIYFAIAAIVMWFVWNKTTLGKNMFAVGGNKEVAAVSGVNVAKAIMGVYLVAGVLYGIASFLEAGRIGSVSTPSSLNYELDAISACLIGGVSYMGGRGKIFGVVCGIFLLQMFNYSMSFFSINPYLQYILKGLLLILALAIDMRRHLMQRGKTEPN